MHIHASLHDEITFSTLTFTTIACKMLKLTSGNLHAPSLAPRRASDGHLKYDVLRIFFSLLCNAQRWAVLVPITEHT